MGKRSNRSRRIIFGEKLMDWGNLIFVGLVISQVVPGTEPFRWEIALIGILLFTSAYVLSYFLLEGGDS